MTTIWGTAAPRRRVSRLGAALLLAMAALVPVSAGAHGIAGSLPSLPRFHPHPHLHARAPLTGLTRLTGLTGRELAQVVVAPGDLIAAGWSISMPSPHRSATVDITGISATIPMACATGGQLLPHNFVIHIPDASVSIAANDTAWHATASPAAAQGYQVSTGAHPACAGILLRTGPATYAATLLSRDTADRFALRFHDVDPRTNGMLGGRLNPSTNCASLSSNPTGLLRCGAPWTSALTRLAGSLPVTGVVRAVLPAVRSALHSATHIASTVRSRPAAVPAPASPAGSAVHAQVVPPVALRVQPPRGPSQPTVAAPAPIVAPAIDSVTAGVGRALPWSWFLVLAMLDIGLIVALVVKRRYPHRDGSTGRRR